MLTFQNIIAPQYFQHFYCKASACHDSCCIGWDVVIDQATYDLYQQCQDRFLKPLFHEHIVINTERAGNSKYIPYARIKMNNFICPLLSDDSLCLIQRSLGEDALSITCATYPRTFNSVDGVLEQSLCVSCPEAARLVLLDENPIQFDSVKKAVSLRNDMMPVLNTGNCQLPPKPYRHFQTIRAFIISLLQDRTYLLWQRLIILSVFCNRLGEIKAEHYNEEIPELIGYFTNNIQEGVFRNQFDNADNPASLHLQLQAMKILIDHRLQSGAVSERFLTCVNKFMQGIGYTADTSLEEAYLQYTQAYTTYYQPFMEKHEYILENYLVNYVFKNLFPLGAQKGLYIEERSIYSEYVLLIIQYSLIKTLLIGIAGYYRIDFNANHVIELIQIFAKGVEHNLPYLKQAVQFMEASNMNNTGGMTILIRN